MAAATRSGQLYHGRQGRSSRPSSRSAGEFDVEGLEHIPATGGAIICPNHTSVLDSFFVPLVLPRRITYVGKAEYMDNWKTKYLFPALGMIPIDRAGGDAARAGARRRRPRPRAGRALRHLPRGHPRPRRRAPPGPHRPGPAGAAHRRARSSRSASRAPARSSRPTPSSRSRSSRCTIRFGEPIDVDRYHDRADDRLVLRQITDEVMYEIREPVGPGVRRRVRDQEGRVDPGRDRRRRPPARAGSTAAARAVDAVRDRATTSSSAAAAVVGRRAARRRSSTCVDR